MIQDRCLVLFGDLHQLTSGFILEHLLAVHTWLKEHPEWRLIFDGVVPDALTYLPRAGAGNIIVTSLSDWQQRDERKRHAPVGVQ